MSHVCVCILLNRASFSPSLAREFANIYSLDFKSNANQKRNYKNEVVLCRGLNKK